MHKILIFSGTTEGRKLAEKLALAGVDCHVCVATEYGSQVMETSEHIFIHQGRLDGQGMKELYRRIQPELVVDATHPYASLVTQTIRQSAEESRIPYLRLLRQESLVDGEKQEIYEDVRSLAAALEMTEGPVFLTTGSKELAVFCQKESLRKRLIVRVLPGRESIDLCYANSLEGRQIIAMQGPFSYEMNRLLMQQYGIRHLVTKDSGRAGGQLEKIQAAEDLGICVHRIRRPQEGVEGYSFAQVWEILSSSFSLPVYEAKLSVYLAGIGCGAPSQRTREVEEILQKSSYIFGAARMLEGLSTGAKTYPYYRKEEILPMLEEIRRVDPEALVTILFSGDSGFYSGASDLAKALKENEKNQVQILPGISSLSLFAARLGVTYQDAALLSMHGLSREEWLPALKDALARKEKIFLLTSGKKDLEKLGTLLEEEEALGRNFHLYLGYRLSYSEEIVEEIRPIQCKELKEDGLYVAAILQDKPKSLPCLPDLRDQDFLRDQVPMTKEEVRMLSLCKLQPKRNSVCLDIGSGTGSIALSLGRLSPYIRVYGLEYKPKALELSRQNLEKFHLTNVEFIEAKAPEGLENLPVADCAFIGGSGGNLKEILTKLYDINPAMRVVVNAVSMETIGEMERLLKVLPLREKEILQLSIAKTKSLGSYEMLTANNPVFLFAFTFGPKEEV